MILQESSQKSHEFGLRKLAPQARSRAVGESEEGAAHMSRAVGGDDAFGPVSCCERLDDGGVVVVASIVVDGRGGRPAVRIQGVRRGPVARVVVDPRGGEVDACAGGEDVIGRRCSSWRIIRGTDKDGLWLIDHLGDEDHARVQSEDLILCDGILLQKVGKKNREERKRVGGEIGVLHTIKPYVY